MAQTGYTPILIYGSSTASATPSASNLTSSANGAELALNYTDGKLYYKDNTGTVQLLASKDGASGSVTSVAQTFTGGIISVAGSPITTSGTLALTVAGTSGGIPYFSSSSAWASSAALAANAIVIGGGAGVAPATTTTGTGVVTAIGNNTNAANGLAVLGAGGALAPAQGGTGLTTTTAYSVVFTGTTATGNFQASAGPGISGQVLTSNGAGALPTFQPVAASNVFAATASGAITANKPCILNSDGTVSEVVFNQYSVSANQPITPSPVWYPIGNFADIGNNNLALLVYDATTGYPGIVVATLSGAGNTTITWSAMTVLTTARTYPGTVPTRVSAPRMVFDAANNKLIVGWISGSNADLGRGVPIGDELDFIVCTVSGTTITPGALNAFSGTAAGMFIGFSLVWDSSANRIVGFYGSYGPSFNPELAYQLFSISGTTVSRVTTESFCTGDNNRFSSAALFTYEPNSNRIIVITNNPAASNNRVVFSLSNSGSALSVSASSSRGNIGYTSVLPIVGTAAVLVAGDGSPFVQPFAIGASSITAGTGLTLSSLSGSSLPALSRTAAAGICFYTVPGVTTYGKAIVSMTSSAVTVVSPSGVNNVAFGGANPYLFLLYAYSSSAGVGLVLDDSGFTVANPPYNAYAGNAIGTNLSSAVQFIGFATAAAINGASVNIATMGAQIPGQSGLVLPNLYYVQTNGTLSTTPGSPSVLAGYALKSDTLLVKGTGT